MNLDAFLPCYEVRERHRMRVRASAEQSWAQVCEMDLEEVWLVKAIVRTREFLLGAKPVQRAGPQGFFPKMAAMGWGPLHEIQGREVVMGAVTKPWEGNVVFRPFPEEQFVAYEEPGWVKIVWGIAVVPVEGGCEVMTETRVQTTDEEARRRFRRYWRWVSPGVMLIRWALLWDVKRRAERAA